MKEYWKNTFWLGLIGALAIIFLSVVDAKAGVKDISNLNWKASVSKGKKFKSYEIVKAKDGEPAIGEKSFKFTLMPYDCGRDSGWSDCDNGGQVRARSEVSSWNDSFTGNDSERWFSFSIYVPEDFESAYPTSTSFFQVYKQAKKKSLGPVFMLRDQGGDRLVAELHGTQYDPHYCSGCTSVISGNSTLMKISDMKGKWVHFKVHMKYTDNKDGFWKFYVNDELKYHVAGTTKGIVGADRLFLKAGLYQTGTDRYKRLHNKDIPAQTIYIDNIYLSKSETKLLKLINKSK